MVQTYGKLHLVTMANIPHCLLECRQYGMPSVPKSVYRYICKCDAHIYICEATFVYVRPHLYMCM